MIFFGEGLVYQNSTPFPASPLQPLTDYMSSKEIFHQARSRVIINFAEEPILLGKLATSTLCRHTPLYCQLRRRSVVLLRYRHRLRRLKEF